MKRNKILIFLILILTAFASFAGCANAASKPNKKIDLYKYTYKHPMIISHRGSPLKYPEHSFAGYSDAIKKGSKFIEQDIVLSKDNKLVVSHDNNLKRIMNKDINISDTNYSALKKYKQNNGEPLHTIEQIFKKYGNKTNYVIETKYSARNDFKMEKELIKSIKKYNLQNNIILQSFDLKSLNYMNKQLKNTPEMLLLKGTQENALKAIAAVPKNIKIITLAEPLVNKTTVTAIEKKNILAMAYTIDHNKQFKNIKHNKLQGMFTNDTKTAVKYYK